MPRQATGNAFSSGGNWYARVSLGEGKRKAVRLQTATTETEAIRRATLLATLVGELRTANKEDFIPTVLEQIGKLEDAKLRAFEKLARGFATGKEKRAGSTSSDALSFAEFGRQWTSGALARRFPDRIKVKRTAKDDDYRLEKWVYPLIGHLPLSEVTLDHYDDVLAAIDEGLSSASRRHVAQVMRRVLALAVYPARHLAANPVPPGALPNKDSGRAKAYLYPEGDRTLLACAKVPLANRLLYGFLAREGLRRGEALELTWSLLDFERGTIRMEMANKTDDHRARALDPAVTRALKAWQKHLGRQPQQRSR